MPMASAPQTGGGNGVAFHRAAGKSAAAALKTHGSEHRQVTVFFGRQDGGFQLVQVGHRLQKDEVGSGSSTSADDLGKFFVGILKSEGTGGGQQFAQGADVQRYQCAGFLPGTAGAGDGSRDDFLDTTAAASQLFGVGTKGVGQQDVRPGGRIIAVDGC